MAISHYRVTRKIINYFYKKSYDYHCVYVLTYHIRSRLHLGLGDNPGCRYRPAILVCSACGHSGKCWQLNPTNTSSNPNIRYLETTDGRIQEVIKLQKLDGIIASMGTIANMGTILNMVFYTILLP